MAAKRSGAGPTVVLVGRPNVGKSTLFNKITGTRRSIVAPVAGTTRDVIAQPADWQGLQFELVDTGGLFGASEVPLHDLVVEHGRGRLSRADLIVFLVDGREGLVPGDEDIAQALRELGVPVILAVNKMDDKRARDRSLEFYRFVFDPVIEIVRRARTGRRRPAGRSGEARARDIVANARLIDESKLDNSKALVLSKVKIKNKTTGQEMTYVLVAENEADLKSGKISVSSPIGKGLLGKKVGDVAEIAVPSGKMQFEIVEISR